MNRALALLLSSVAVGACADPSNDTGVSSTGEPSTSSTDPDSSTSSTSSSGGSTSSSETSSSGVDGSSSSGEDSSSESSTGSASLQVQLETTLGVIVLELDDVAAPVTTANFFTYLDGGFFDGTDGNGATIFHRVVPGFVVQGGGLTEALETKTTLPPIVNESGNGLANVRGAVAMARTKDPDSATSQFFVNLVDNDLLDDPPGYAVFGHVIEGMDVVDAMAAAATETVGDYDDVPVEPIVVLSATRL